MINGELIDLVAGDYTAEVATCGATLVSLRRGGRDLVLPFDARATLPAGWQGKTLAPWPNRVKDSRYTYAGSELLLPCNEPATGSALHGLVGWADFQVRERTSAPDRDTVVVELVLPASYGYPWALEIEVAFTLDAQDGLTVVTRATSLGAAQSPGEHTPGAPARDGVVAPAPYGVSCHPYLTRSVPLDECVLQVEAAQVLEVDPTSMAPVALVDVEGTELDWREGRVVGSTVTDNAYTGLPEGTWQVRLRGGAGDRTVVMSAQVPWVQLYSADALGRVGIAVEPMTCPPDAFNSGTDLITLEVGQSHEFTYRIHEED